MSPMMPKSEYFGTDMPMDPTMGAGGAGMDAMPPVTPAAARPDDPVDSLSVLERLAVQAGENPEEVRMIIEGEDPEGIQRLLAIAKPLATSMEDKGALDMLSRQVPPDASAIPPGPVSPEEDMQFQPDRPY